MSRRRYLPMVVECKCPGPLRRTAGWACLVDRGAGAARVGAWPFVLLLLAREVLAPTTLHTDGAPCPSLSLSYLPTCYRAVQLEAQGVAQRRRRTVV